MVRRLLLITGLAALVGYFLRRRHVEDRPDGAIDPADELRRTLDEARSRDATKPAPELSDDLDARRRQVHERARASADEMRGSAPD